jgi:hypothetical protein
MKILETRKQKLHAQIFKSEVFYYKNSDCSLSGYNISLAGGQQYQYGRDVSVTQKTVIHVITHFN